MKRQLKKALRRYLFWAIGLMVCWLLLWDEFSAANAIGGLLVAVLLLAAFPLAPVTGDDRRLRFRPVGMIRLALAVLKDVVVSNVLVTRLILSPHRSVRTGVVGCRMHTESPRIFATVANIAALSPGTMAVDSLREPPTLFVHVLSLDDPIRVRRRIAYIERLAVEAFGSRRDRNAIALEAAAVESAAAGPDALAEVSGDVIVAEQQEPRR